jgi:hypothetical protein
MELLAIRKTEQLVEACVLTPPVAHALQADNGAIRAALWLAPPLARLEAVRIVKDAVKKARVKKDSCKSRKSQQNQSFREQLISIRSHGWIYRRGATTGAGQHFLSGAS